MNFAIIAAGEGSRLAAEGVTVPKPLVPIGDVPLIERLINIFIRNEATTVNVIVNSENRQTIRHLHNMWLKVPLQMVVKSTPGSMYSLYELKTFLRGNDFCLTTVDTVFRESEFSKYLEAFRNNPNIDGLMAVTDFIDDEKPLYVATNEKLFITDFCDTRPPEGKYISGGIYCLRAQAFDVLETTMKSGMTRMRDFQRQLIRHGMKLQAYPFSKIVDIDHVADIAQAEKLINQDH